MTETCPVCGWTYLRAEHIPQNPDEDHGPDAPGTHYVHEWTATENGAEIGGCSQYEDGKTTLWSGVDI